LAIGAHGAVRLRRILDVDTNVGDTFDQLQRGGVLGLDVEAGKLSPSLVERYLEIKERGLL
jgi:hypothetical protein